ncbi:MAG: pyruvate kinase, partial [Clostridiales bacterium]|nr:pyruvate kinase [Clostridiales bacterium]
DKKAINLPDVDLDMPFISKVDKEDIEYGIKQKVDYIALSFVRTAQDVLDVRELLKKNKATHIQLVSKIENRQGVNNLAEIIKVSDGIMVARGDMGVEIPYAELPWIQKNMIKACNDAGKFVITATQMLESMINNPRPTRAEVSDVANAVFDGTSATMLSGESAAGKFPVSAVSAMANIIVNVEKGIDYKSKFSKQPLCSDGASAAAGQGACNMAMAAEVQAIVIPTQSGNTVRQVARFKPQQPIIAICMDKQVATQLSCYWGVTAIYGERCTNSDELVKYSLNKAANTGLIKKGDSVVLTMGSQVGKFCVINNTVMQYN